MKIAQLKNNAVFISTPKIRKALTASGYECPTTIDAWPPAYRVYKEPFSNGYLVPTTQGFAAIPLNQAIKEIDVNPLNMATASFDTRFVMKNWERANTYTGWDPEIFVIGEKARLIPAFTFLPHKARATSYTARHVNTITPHRANARVYEDGFQAEFNTEPHNCHGWGMDAIRSGLEGILTAARKVDPAAKLTLKNLFKLPQAQLMAATDEQVSFGCMPSLNAYGAEPLVFDDPRQVPYRSAGGHIHFSGSTLNVKLPKHANQIVQNLDRYAGLPCVALFAGIDNPLRRQFYGRAGEYRLPAHGLEYRVLSNAWLSHPAIAHLVNNAVRGALRVLETTPDPADLSNEEVQEIINNCDVTRARSWVRKHWSLMEKLLSLELGTVSPAVASKQVWLEGIAATIPAYDNLEANWSLHGSWASHTDNSHRTWAGFYPNLHLKAA